MERDIVSILKDRIVSLEEGYEQKIAELSLLKELGEALKGTSLAHWNQLFLRQLDIIKKATASTASRSCSWTTRPTTSTW
jgi:hypothetical protein